MTESTKSLYDPEKHAGLLSVDGNDIIIVDAKQAAIPTWPLKIRQQLALSTRLALRISQGFGSLLVPVDEEQSRVKAEGYRRGIDLLDLPESRNTK